MKRIAMVVMAAYRRITMRLFIAFLPPILSVILLQLSSGGIGPLDALSGIHLDFSTADIGLLGSAHFVGFFIGCWWAPRLMGAVGHSRAFAAFTACGALGITAHMMLVDPLAWALMRVAIGTCVAGCYTVIEAWLQTLVTNETRGRAMGIYRISDMGAALTAQLMIGILAPASYFSYSVLTLICCAALLPFTLTRAKEPTIAQAPRLRPKLALLRSPLGTLAVMVAALSGASFRMVGPLYGQKIGLAAEEIAYFLAAFVLGGAIAQYPVGWFADKFDRRAVLIWLSAAAIISCTLNIFLDDISVVASYILVGFFGMTTYPIYSVAAAHTHDFASDDERVELSAALMFFYALGAIFAPYTTSGLMTLYGPSALFSIIAMGHVALILFGLLRMRKRPTATLRTPFVQAPRSSFTVGRLFARARNVDPKNQ